MLGALPRRSLALLLDGAPPVPEMLPLAAAPSRQPGFSHTPERSGLPSKNVGAGALRSTDPSGRRGASARLKSGHCAAGAAASAVTSATNPLAKTLVFIPP